MVCLGPDIAALLPRKPKWLHQRRLRWILTSTARFSGSLPGSSGQRRQFALAFVAIAVAIAWFTLVVNEQFRSDSSERSFSERSGELIDQGKEREVLSLVEDREKDFPKDVYVHWYRGRALYQLGRYDEALAAFSKAEELAPSWKVSHTEPYISSIKLKLGRGSAESGNSRPASSPPR